MEANIKEIVSKYYSKELIENIGIFKNRVIITIIGGYNEGFDALIKSEIIKLKDDFKVSVVHTEEKETLTKNVNPFDNKWKIRGVKKIIVVASGKGGVGKSTTSVNLALALANKGQKVALFDADIYGPSIPTMLGYEGENVKSLDKKTFEPFLNMNIKSMSIGALIDKDTPLIWRSSKAILALEQLISDTNWDNDNLGEGVDVMVIDMPPGTGDIQLSLAQKINIDGAVIVSTPQDIALIDAVKGVNMFKKVNVPIFGVVENMSYYICDNCGTRADIFGHEGAKKTAMKLGVDFLGEIPLHMDIRENSDNGTPVVFALPESSYTKAYEEIAEKIIIKLAKND